VFAFIGQAVVEAHATAKGDRPPDRRQGLWRFGGQGFAIGLDHRAQFVGRHEGINQADVVGLLRRDYLAVAKQADGPWAADQAGQGLGGVDGGI